MARKTQQARRTAKRQGVAQGKQTDELQRGPSASSEAAVAATAVPEAAELAQESAPAPAAIAERSGEPRGPAALTPAPQHEPALGSDAPLAVQAPLQPAEGSASPAPPTKEEPAEPSADAISLGPQGPDVALEDPTLKIDEPSLLDDVADEPQEPCVTAAQRLEEQPADAAPTSPPAAARPASPLADDVVIASGDPEPDMKTIAALEESALEIDEPPLAPSSHAVGMGEVKEPSVVVHQRSEDPAPMQLSTGAALADTVATSEPQKPDVATSTTVHGSTSAVEEKKKATVAAQSDGSAAPDAEAAPVFQAPVAEEIAEPPTIEKISKLEVQTALPARVADIPSPCRERMSPKNTGSETPRTENPRRDCWQMTAGALWKLLFGLPAQQQEQAR